MHKKANNYQNIRGDKDETKVPLGPRVTPTSSASFSMLAWRKDLELWPKAISSALARTTIGLQLPPLALLLKPERCTSQDQIPITKWPSHEPQQETTNRAITATADLPRKNMTREANVSRRKQKTERDPSRGA